MFSFLKDRFFAFCSSFSNKIKSLFSGDKFGERELEQFFEILVSFDMGITLSRMIVNELKQEIEIGKITKSEQLLDSVKHKLHAILEKASNKPQNTSPEVLLLFGINGAGKTTTAAKLANLFAKQGKKVLLVAADTYRAAAVSQLEAWASKTGVDLFVGLENSDPASVIFDAGKLAEEKNYDNVIIDTSGRLHTNPNLLKELEKCTKVARKVFSPKFLTNWIVVDAMLGQNSLEQVRVFKEALDLNGVVLTKLDGSAKGGVIFGIAQSFDLPVIYVTIAENDLAGIKIFSPNEYIERLFS